ncbi:lasso peptide biosynthesis B2 protein [Nocardiopsis alba]|uniref:lasso peptide biosynthesis B2 protein n=1 Tax=Nocardiopsis alba TaxID=53437 RepID=UPI0036517480
MRPTHRAASGTPEARPRCDLRRPSRAPFHVGAQRRWKGPSLCLELSLAAALTGILMRGAVDWCIGVRLMPYAAHAWVEAEGTPIGEQEEPDRPFIVITRT